MRVFDTLRREKVALPLSKGDGGRPELKLYVCGITPYDSGHLGHAFTFCAFDVLVRHQESRGVRVRYVQNVTDVDDPLFERARRTGQDWKRLAEREQAAFVRDMTALGWRPPDVMPRVSEEIPGILAAAEAIEEQGAAYRGLDGSLYFEAARYPGYGRLSRRSRTSMLRKLRDEGLLGEVAPGAKRDALDFPLWRPSLPDEPAWPSPYGPGRPGWHLECSAMSMRYLGARVDVHGGGRDLVFSHHECERAQSETLTGEAPFARAWMHTGMVRFAGRKMSKSLGNLVVVGEVLGRGVPAAALRLYLLAHRYRRDWSFAWEELAPFVELVSSPAGGGRASRELLDRFQAALEDDLDTPRALRALQAALRTGDAAAAEMLPVLAGQASVSR
jgi:L-cysteine:1D-myo-inositol 2-amino-2-deoxy-alpha-D-glucopyranoside ligase